MSAAYVVAAVRTPGGKAKKGKLKDVRPDDLAAVAIRALLARTGIDPALVEDVILGCAFPEGEAGMNVARVAALRAGLPKEVPGQTVNRFCASGLQTVATAAERIIAGGADCIVAGGTESMSMIPMGGNKYSANPGLTGAWPESYAAMGITAELVAQRYEVSREDQDAFAAESQQRAERAIAEGRFAKEIVAVEVPQRKGAPLRVDRDEYPRAGTTVEKLAGLKAAFKKDGSVTAGNASGINDGAAALVLAAESGLAKAGARPLARVVAYCTTGVDPAIMGMGPVEAIRKALQRAKLDAAQIDLFELNEAFASQSLAVSRELGLDPSRVNVYGGAIALGHPIGASGARILTTLIHALHARNARYGVAALCVGGGMGTALIVERM